ncbi:MAG: LacI family transcriptional regulator [Lachnospiraceae bacterium]|nr:LacI family transcriptional regulator [Lachnospiraceae bacterium]
MVSMKDISKVCGVSVATVSKALNDHTDIGEATKQHIRQVASEMGYYPNSAAKMLKTNRSRNIGVLFKDHAASGLTHEYFAMMLDHFKTEVEKQGYDLTFINTEGRSEEGRLTYLAHARYRSFDGVLIACVNDFLAPEVLELVRSDIPVVSIDHVYEGHTAVMSDNAQGMRDLVNFCYRQGHRRIALIHGEDRDVTSIRLDTFRETTKQLGLEIPEEYIRTSDYRDTDGAMKRTRELLALPVPPTCILYPDDFSALGGIDEIKAKGLRIPEDISIVGYDGIRISRHLVPRLTTLRQSTEQIGEIAAKKLIEAMERPGKVKPEQVVIGGEVYKGESVAQIG